MTYLVPNETIALIEARAPQARKDRKLSVEVVDALKACGFFKMFLPKRWGGLEARPQEFFREQIRIAEADMSHAWAGGIVAIHAFQIAIMDERAQAAVYQDDPNTLVSSSYNPVSAKAEQVDGGCMVSGRWGWSSGSEHCSWALLGGIVPGEGYRTFLIPRTQYAIEDTWDVMGLQATGSHDIVIDTPIFVPDYMSHKRDDGFHCRHEQSNALYDLSWAQGFVRVVNTPAIGALRKALRLFIESRSGGFSTTTDMTKFAADVEIQERVAKVKNIISELESVLFGNFDKMEAAQWQPTLDERIFYRYQASLVIPKCIEGIDLLFDSAGGRSVFNGSAMMNLWHDIHIARCHVANNPTPFARNLGSTQLGTENTDVFI
ncbi:MAG TPA: flavin-dependent monooxygenase [Halieaceae bacterium]|nr:flavin-dependent monooxygenase [Halieaceae bacterium]